MKNCKCISVPDIDLCLKSGDIIKLGRFEYEQWQVLYGWYTWGGNRAVCGWYLVRCSDKMVKPLQLTDLDDIYMIE